MTREVILDTVKLCVCSDRNNQYGEPEDNFATIALFWETYLNSCEGNNVGIGAKDVAVMMALLKIARIATGNPKADNWIDLAGYAACGGEIEEDALWHQ